MKKTMVAFSILLIGLVFMATATFNFITTPVDQLITKGAYRFSRNPMYLATLLICVGSGLAAASWPLLIISIILTLCLHREALIEERYCLNSYGAVYQDYVTSTPRWIGIPKKHNQ